MRKTLTCLAFVLLVLAGFASVLSVEPPGIFAFSDKMVYGRPAEVTVFGIVLDDDGRPVPQVRLSMDVLNPEGEIIHSTEFSSGSDGRFIRSFRLSSSAVEGTYQVIVADSEGDYEPAVFFFEVCAVCSFLPTVYATTVSATVVVSTTVVRTAVVTTTFTRDLTRLETVISTVGGGRVLTVTSTFYSVLNGTVVTVTRSVEGGLEGSYVFYVGLGMVGVLAVVSFIAVRRFRPPA
ncbi:MAG: MG2 domain-containing protein [Candidatus Caldarchaeum sp.]|nr:MG2 domain-containing protein [Candidatus Caldarchaeum sp.]MCS7137641.1 MG2 domain-containing protein [Candidatus Caldarchaeum sp.]MDW7978750.1 MG2 domain-containing protein [Candidatus Caldarchaeum sp.]MDW8359141.1 MG2 domain-containing protein [Candidatus Caldarchaeum sp.]